MHPTSSKAEKNIDTATLTAIILTLLQGHPALAEMHGYRSSACEADVDAAKRQISGEISDRIKCGDSSPATQRGGWTCRPSSRKACGKISFDCITQYDCPRSELPIAQNPRKEARRSPASDSDSKRTPAKPESAHPIPGSKAAGTHDWPQDFDAYLKPSGNCVGMPGIPETPPMGSPDGPVSREYIGFLKEQVCRTMRFKKAFEASPARICPGVDPTSFGECYSKILNTTVSKVGLDTTGFVLMHSLAIMYLVKNKEAFRDKTEAALSIIEAGWSNLDAFDKRVRPDRFSSKFSPQTASIKFESEELLRIDHEVSAKYATSLLQKSEQLLRKLEAALENDRSPASLRSKIRVLENRKKLLGFSSRWKHRPSQ